MYVNLYYTAQLQRQNCKTRFRADAVVSYGKLKLPLSDKLLLTVMNLEVARILPRWIPRIRAEWEKLLLDLNFNSSVPLFLNTLINRKTQTAYQKSPCDKIQKLWRYSLRKYVYNYRN